MFTVSVVIPTYNGRNFIARAIESALQQTISPMEIIVADDGSSDETLKIVRGFKDKVRLFALKHTGMPAAGRNLGIKKARGEFIAFLDQDDLWPSDKLEIQQENFRNMPDLDIDVGFSKIIDANDNKHIDTLNADDAELIRQFLLSSMLIKKTAFDRIGLFDETMQYYGSDLDWIFRARENQLSFHVHNELTLFYRLHENNHSNNIDLFRKARREVIKKSLTRRYLSSNKGFQPVPPMNKYNSSSL